MEYIAIEWNEYTKRVFWCFFNHKQALFILLLLLTWGQTTKDIISNEKEKPSAVSGSYQLSLSRLYDMQHVQQSLHFLRIGSYYSQFQMFSFNVNRKINSFLCYFQPVEKSICQYNLIGYFSSGMHGLFVCFITWKLSPVMHTWSILSKKDTLSS